MRCTFFGHRDSPREIIGVLRELLIFLIEAKDVDTFYVGNHGEFDDMVRSELTNLSTVYSHIKVFTVLAYMPRGREEYSTATLFPEGMEFSMPRFAILKRNDWMIDNSDCVVAYVKRSGGNSTRFLETARRKKKLIYNIADRQAPNNTTERKADAQ